MKEKTERTELAEKLIDLRKERGLNAKEAAEAIGIDYQNYRKYETVILPKSDVYIKIADFYNVSVDYLMGRKDREEDSFDNHIPSIGKSLTLHQERSPYIVVENDLGELSDLEIMIIKKLRGFSPEEKSDFVKYFNSK